MCATCANERHLRFTALHQLNEVSEEHVAVPLTEAFRVVGHLGETDVRGIRSIKEGEARLYDTWVNTKAGVAASRISFLSKPDLSNLSYLCSTVVCD